MKILLLNDNPVVNKLVTLSAQKTSDELEVLDNISDIKAGKYDLLVVDDTLYTDDLIAQVKEKISFRKSLYICSRDAAQSDDFSTIIKKPFLPTDLVELFSSLGREVQNSAPDDMEEISLEETSEFDELEEISLTPDDEDLGDEISLEELSLDLDTGDMSDNKDSQKIDLDNLDDLASEGFLDELEEPESEEESEGILDKDELKEVQDLLELDDDLDDDDLDGLDLDEELDFDLDEEIKIDDINLGDETSESDAIDALDFEDDSLDDLDDALDEVLELDNPEELGTEEVLETPTDAIETEDNLDLEDDLDEVLELDEPDELVAEEVIEAEDDLELEELSLDETDIDEALELDTEDEESVSLDDELELEDDLESVLEEEISLDEEIEIEEELPDLVDEAESLNIEDQITNAVNELSQEDLDSELDAETLLDIATSEIDSIDGLNSRDLKMAFGEEVPELEEAPEAEPQENELEDELDDEVSTLTDIEITPDNEGVESLKKLLEALSDKDVAASMKGMKISINIELGDNK